LNGEEVAGTNRKRLKKVEEFTRPTLRGFVVREARAKLRVAQESPDRSNKMDTADQEKVKIIVLKRSSEKAIGRRPIMKQQALLQ